MTPYTMGIAFSPYTDYDHALAVVRKFEKDTRESQILIAAVNLLLDRAIKEKEAKLATAEVVEMTKRFHNPVVKEVKVNHLYTSGEDVAERR